MFVTDLWCRFSHSIPIVIILVSAFSIMMISIDRWMCVVYSRQRQLNCRDIIIIIAIIWGLSLSLAAPTFFHRQKQENLIIDSMKDEFYKALSLSYFEGANDQLSSNLSLETKMMINISNNFMNIYDENINLCIENWSYPYFKRMYVLTLFGLEFFLPCLTMLITYIWIIGFLNKHEQQIKNRRRSQISQTTTNHRYKQNCLLLTSLCLTFFICSLPLSLFNILLDVFFDSIWIQKNEKTIYWLVIVLTTLQLLNIIISPILYGFMNQNFRKEFNKLKQTIENKFCAKSTNIEMSLEIQFSRREFSLNSDDIHMNIMIPLSKKEDV
jgi:neuropeptide F receptor